MLESDVLSLSSDFAVRQKGCTLHDRPLHARHTIHAPGNYVLQALAHGVRYGVLKQLATARGVTDAQLGELLGFLSSIGALQYGPRTARQRLAHLRTGAAHGALGIRYAARVWRRPATAGMVARAAWRACLPVTVATLAVGGLFAAAGLCSAGSALGLGLGGLAGFIASVGLHEYAHIAIIRRHTVPVLLQHGLRLGVVHQPLPAGAEIVSAYAGPAAGIAWCGMLAALAALMGQSLLSALLTCAGVFHLASLLPWYGDGHSIRQALKRRAAPA